MFCINRYIERLLDRISNGALPEDRRFAMTELQAVVAESKAGQLAFGAMGEYLLIKYMFMSCLLFPFVIVLLLCRFSGDFECPKGRKGRC